MSDTNNSSASNPDGIAVIGMSGRFPKASNITQFWNNLVEGKDCLETFSTEDLRKAGIAEPTLNDCHFVRRGGRITDPEFFDAPFFGYTPREASLLDPQHRIFLECGWEAIESAGYDVSSLKCRVGVFAGCGMNHYLIHNIISNPDITASANEIQIVIGNDKDFLSTRLSYKLDLRGPSFDIQTACSTSLVAIHLACENLLTYQCDMALAGGVFLQIPWWHGYMLTDGDIRSPDGICRPFDIKANGTVFGEGAGIVVLKRLEDAIADKDLIYAIVKGSAVNNDGSSKAGYTAPEVESQSEVITMALEAAGVNASDISYVEAHGTGTPLGDPVEMTALTKAFRRYTDRNGFCGIGSVKASIGHLDAASGVSGFIKTVLSLHHKELPPTVNFTEPNPLLEMDRSPFYVVKNRCKWNTSDGSIRRAGVSSLGVGGTNVHIVLEEATQYQLSRQSSASSKKWHLLPVSAKSPVSVKQGLSAFADFFSVNQETNVADAAFTMQQGRQHFPYRQFAVSQSHSDAAQQFSSLARDSSIQKVSVPDNDKIVFMFSGQGSQYLNMGHDLYIEENTFRDSFDICCDLLIKHNVKDLRTILFSDKLENEAMISQTDITQPLLFSFEYSLVKYFNSLGIIPSALVGHSIGEYVAACISGVFSLEDALHIVADRGRIMSSQPPGRMLSVSEDSQIIKQLLGENIELSLVNAPDLCVVSGKEEHLTAFQKILSEKNIDNRTLHTLHAFHSRLMDGAVKPLTDLISGFKLDIPSIPFISNVSGTWITQSEATSAAYWGQHMRKCVNFSGGISKLIDDGYRVFLEIGAGNSLVSFVNRVAANTRSPDNNTVNSKVITASSVRHSKLKYNDAAFILTSIGQLWQNGLRIDWTKFYTDEKRVRVSMPTYQFDHKRYWIDPVNHPFYGIGVHFKNQPLNNSTQTVTNKNDEPDNSTVSASVSSQNESTEEIVTGIWKRLLGIDSIDPSDNFFELGGDSIWAAQMLARIWEKPGVIITIADLYKNPTLKSLILLIDENRAKNRNSEISMPVRSDQISDILLSSSQQRLWFMSQLEPDSPAYNLATEFVVNGSFNLQTAKEAIDQIVNRHDALRSVFYNTSNGPRIRITDTPEYPFEILDLSDRIIENDSVWIDEIRSRSTIRYDLQTGPLFRILLIRLSEARHIISFMVHHIISDGWSSGVFLRDFTLFYEALLKKEIPVLPDIPFRYADYTNWQASQKLSYNNNLEYWKNVLSGQLPVLDLLTDYTRTPLPSREGSCVRFSINTETSTRLHSLSGKEQTTLFNVLLSIFYTLLSRYSGQTDIIIGAPVANRNNIDFENLIGYFLNTIPFRIRADTETSFIQLIRHIKNITQEAFAHQDIPFDIIVDAVNPPRDLSHPPIFQVLFAFQNFPISPVTIDNTSIHAELVDRGATEFDLSLYMWQSDGQLLGNFEYSTALFDKTTIERLADHFVNIANAVVNSLDTPVSEITFLSESEVNQITGEWNNTIVPFPENECIHDLFRKRVIESPDSIAIIDKVNSYSYSQLDSASDNIAQYLISHNVKQGDLVGICLERHFGMVASLLGILKCGAAYVPLDPDYPQERLLYMAEDAGLKLIITEQSTINRISIVKNAEILELNRDIPVSFSKNTVHVEMKSSPQNTAYIIYTSGSTGKPKGVRIGHRSVVNLLSSMQKKPGISKSDKFFATITLSFDMSVSEIFLSLVTGACAVIVDSETLKDGAKLVELIKKSNPSIMQGTPSLWRLLISAGWNGTSGLKAICAGEPLPYDLVRDLLPRVRELWNMYGPTEITVYATACQITDPEKPILIGFPIDNTFTYILDSSLQPVPVGVSGELYIGGTGLAEGYHKRPDLTNAKFIPDPFTKSGRMYRTGDLARYRPDGAIECLGRIDSQIKIRGFRIELGEIENVALANKDISQCAVLCKDFSAHDRRLILYYTLHKDSELTTGDLRNHLKKSLPEYMIPQLFVYLDTMPLTPSGKIDRNRLAELYTANSSSSSGNYVAPVNDLQRTLVRIWQEILGNPAIGIQDNFFELGGHSLLAVNMASAFFKKTGINLPLAKLITTPTIEGLTSSLQSADTAKTVQSVPDLNSVNHFSYVVPIKATGNRLPFFCIHGVGGNVLNYNCFVPYLDHEQPLYGIQCKGLDGINKPFDSIEFMAASYIDEIRKLQPHGPYLIGGGSMGGLIAYEMAQQLSSINESVDLLLMFDTACPYNINKFIKSMKQKAIIKPSNFPLVKHLSHSIQCRISDLIKHSICKSYRLRNQPIPQELRYWLIEQKHLSLINSYIPQPYKGQITMFRALQNTENPDPYRGWKDVATGGMKIMDFECKHINMIQSVDVAKAINTVLLTHSNSM